jgi:PTH1 family peptidyl-tRNA hydrolase
VVQRGHNGLKNIELVLNGTRLFPFAFWHWRLPFSKGQQVDFVLSNFKQNEFDELPAVMDKAEEMVKIILHTGDPEKNHEFI